jgi:uncharacterized membrane protein
MLMGMVVWVAGGDHGAPAATPAELLGDLGAGDRLMLAGVIVLAVTPALGVIALLILWFRERAWRFAGTAALVFVLLCVAFWAGGG